MDTISRAVLFCIPRHFDRSVTLSRSLRGGICLLLLLLLAGSLSAGIPLSGKQRIRSSAGGAAVRAALDAVASGHAVRPHHSWSKPLFMAVPGMATPFIAASHERAGTCLLAVSGALLLLVTIVLLLRAVLNLRTLRQRMKEHERRYNLAVENGNDGIFIVRDGSIEYANQPLLHMTGFPKKELLGKHFSLLIAPSVKDRFINEYYSRTRLKNVADVYETAVVSRDKGAVTVELRIYSCQHGGGDAELHVVRDITARKQLADERRRFSSFIDKNPHPLVEVLPDGSIYYANESALRRFPLLMSEGAENAFLEGFYHQAAVLKSGGKEVCSHELMIGGRWYHRECSYAKETGRFRVYGFDVTDHKRAEESLMRSEEKYRTLFETISQGIMYHGTDGKIIAANPAAERILGLPMQQLIYKNCGEIFRHGVREDGTDLSPTAYPPMIALSTGREVKDAVIGIRTDNGLRWLSMSALPQFVAGDTAPCLVYTVFNDVTEKRRTENELLASEARYRRLFESSRDGIIIADGKSGDVIDVNPFLAGLTGCPREELIGRKLWELNFLKEVVPHRAAFIEMLLQEYVRRDGVRVLGREGRVLDAEFVGNVYSVGRRKVIQCGIRDISERKNAEDQVKYLSFHDKVTGLYNRTYAEEELQRIDTERSLPVSIIMGDVNNLKLVNDAFGHATGDRLLVRIAGVLHAACRNDDIVARWGGDEFIVLLPKTDGKTAAEIAQRIQKECVQEGARPVDPAIALGVATKNQADRDISEVLREAEDRMYRQKIAESKSRQNAILSSLLRALREQGLETVQHTQRLKRLAVELGREAGLSDSRMDDLALLAVLHDVGKIAVPDDILAKNGALTPHEWRIVRKHSEAGYRIIQSFTALSHLADAVLAHHERWDGTGYPQGLKGNEIPLIARVFAVVEAYDVMLHEKPYGHPVPRELAMEELKRCAGSQFDPALVELFIERIEPLRIITGEKIPVLTAVHG